MSVLGRLVWGESSRVQRSQSGDIPGPLDNYGGTSDGFHGPSEERAMRHSGVWAAVGLRSDLMSVFPAYAYVDRPTTPERVGGRMRVEPTPMILRYPTLGAGKTQDVSMSEFAGMGEMALCLRGNCYATIFRDLSTRVIGLQMHHPDTVSIRWDRDGQAMWYDVLGTKVLPTDMWHRRRRLIPGTPVGMSAISYARVAIQLGLSAEEFGARFFTDGAHPTGLLKSKNQLTQDQAEMAKSRFMNAVRGRREVAVIGGDWEYSQIQVSPSDSQFLDTISANLTTIARFINVPPELIGGSAAGHRALTYANLADRALNLLVFNMSAAIRGWEEGLTEVLPGGKYGGQYCKLHTDELMRMDPKTRADVNRLKLANAETNPDELRAESDKPPLPNHQGEIFVWPPTGPTAPSVNDPAPANPPDEGTLS